MLQKPKKINFDKVDIGIVQIKHISADSDAVIELISTLTGDDKENMRWQWAVLSIAHLLEDFNFTLDEKSDLMEGLSAAFAKEFALDQSLKVSLDKKYRKQKEVIKALICPRLVDRGQDAWGAIYKRRSQANNTLAAKLLERHNKHEIKDLLESYIHMSLNHIFSSAQRQQEFVLYYLLAKHYHSQVKIQQQKQIKESTCNYSLV